MVCIKESSFLIFCVLAQVVLTESTTLLRATSSPCMPAQTVGLSTSLSSRVTVTIPDQTSPQGKDGIDTITTTCGYGGSCPSVTTMVVSNPAPYEYCFNTSWPVLTFNVTSGGPGTTEGVFVVNPIVDFPETWVNGANVLLSGDQVGPSGNTDCKTMNGTTDTEPFVVCMVPSSLF